MKSLATASMNVNAQPSSAGQREYSPNLGLTLPREAGGKSHRSAPVSSPSAAETRGGAESFLRVRAEKVRVLTLVPQLFGFRTASILLALWYLCALASPCHPDAIPIKRKNQKDVKSQPPPEAADTENGDNFV